MCRTCGDTNMDVQIWKFQSLPIRDTLPPFGLFAIAQDNDFFFSWSGRALSVCVEKGFFSLVYGISSDYLGDLGFVGFALDCSLLSVNAAMVTGQ
ncbi:hypothetical protein MTR67_001712 [Solanum verrucosum]|uniref:Uncharacterized protein n=1 Tax=Solanum verrucosum TaxID=315347 RepID=A0AAF0PPQ1_SOLVR|nr:hypothetical protein MTR67_001712 [Solanum verrucosum]